ncbi:MAG: BamA/TamA family outer membrane protein [Candidatus Aegiribacteria sp.]|nr:BamA/TamA family outer membrane protein [Candidatus Aegiribacteria sp.]MBD3294588.1 BamA/TamA family outer membrane protein [Candidatus Fermentibacteria bacterium]
MANLRSMGFLEPAVKVNWPLWDDEVNIVRIDVQSGRRSMLSGLVFSGNTVFTADSLAQFYPGETGDPITPDDTLSFRNRIASAYNRRGYIYSQIDLRLLDFGSTETEESDRALECNVSEGRQAFLDSVSVNGLETVRRKVVTRELLIHSGDSLNMELLRQSISSIYQLGLFRDVRFSYDPHSEDSSLVDLSITVNETDYRRVDIGTGYVSPSAVFGSVSWLHPNIMGNNQTLKVGIYLLEYIGSREGRRIEPEIIYQEPWFLSSRWQWQLKFGYLYLFTPAIRQRSYSVTSTFVRDLTRHLEFSTAYSLEYEKYNEWEEDNGFTDTDWRTTSSITASLIHDTRNPVLDPVRGHWMMGEGKLSGGVLGGRDFYRVRSEARLFRQLGRSLVLAGRLRLGGAFPYGDDTTIPPDDRFFLGGGTTVRGYPFNSLGPEDDQGNPLGGRIEILSNFEVRVRIFGNLGAVLFTDAGGLWTSLEEVSFETTGFGTGFGLRYHTVFGPIRLDYGFAPTWRNSLKRGKIYLGIGHAF